MITIDNMHQGYTFRVCSVELLVVQCYRFCWCCSLCLLALLHIPSWWWGSTRGSIHACWTLSLQLPSVCVCGWGGGGGAGANLNIVKRIVTLHWNLTSLIYITIHLKKVSIQMNLKIPCTSWSDWQPSMMHVWIACFIALLLMLLLAKVKVDVFRVWPFSL